MNDDAINDAVTMRPSPSLALGRIDQYELVRELGGGGFGTVYLAKDTVAGIEVAVKGLPPIVKNNLEELENIRANFALVSRLTHTNIAKMLVLHPAQSVVYTSEDAHGKLRVNPGDMLMVMEYAPGVTLSNWRKQFPDRKVPLENALRIVRQIASALDYAHERKIVHRDIKPANVMIETTDEGTVTARVLDFGLAAEIRSSMGRVSQEIRDTSGTRPYMAPEQWLGGKQGPATDQYALAALFHELIVGEVPFAAVFDTGDPVVMMNVVGREPFVAPSELSKTVCKALEKALAKKPDERFTSCCEFVDALEGKVEVSDKGTKSQRKIGPGWILGAVAAVGMIVAGGWWLMRSTPSSAPVTVPAEPAPAAAKSESAPAVAKSEPVPVVAEPEPAPTVAKPEPAPVVVKPASAPVVAKPEPAPVVVKPESAPVVAKPEPVPVVITPAPAVAKSEPVPVVAAPEPTSAVVTPAVIGNVSSPGVDAVKTERTLTVADLMALDTSVLRPGEGREVKLSCGVVLALNWCPPGQFTMNSPLRTMQIDRGFWMGRYEVTQELWTKVMNENPSRFRGSDPASAPVDGVSRDDCIRFVSELNRQNGTDGFHLPLDAEWEYACRAGGSGAAGSTGGICARSKTPQRIGMFKPNEWGLFDMLGNMAEWCNDPYPSELINLFQRDGYILRGGSYKDREDNCTASYRRREATNKRHPMFGMRLCLSVKSSGTKVAESIYPTPMDSETKMASEKKSEPRHGEVRVLTLPGGAKMEMIYCAPGSFKMGDDDGEDDEKPAHVVNLTKGFWLGKCEVTQAQWKSVMGGRNPSSHEGDELPVENVSWDDCRDFIKNMNLKAKYCARLPTEAEWEYACRAGTTGHFAAQGLEKFTLKHPESVNALGRMGWYDGNSGGETHPVGRKQANAWGFHDMHGNVWEWCNDWYDGAYYGASPRCNPKGPSEEGGERVSRGGSYNDLPERCRSAFREKGGTGDCGMTDGFRLCCSVESEELK